jgi:hypothetical protein
VSLVENVVIDDPSLRPLLRNRSSIRLLKGLLRK